MMHRRDFLKLAAALSAAFGIGNLPETVRAALNTINPQEIPRVIYLQGLSCTGCSISLLQAESPSPLALITDYSQLLFHTDLSATSGGQALELIEQYINGGAGEYILAVEGAVPDSMPEACMVGDKTFAQYLLEAARSMSAAIAIGACACDGGIPGAEGNLTGAIGLREFYAKSNISTPVIQIRGCSVHPDWVWQTIVHLVKAGLPELTPDNAPVRFYGRKVHETCPRYHDFQQEIFAQKLGERGCLFKLGCLGPQTMADCSTRWWNGGTTWCVDANAPCIGCASPIFARSKDLPLYRISSNEDPTTP
mgnify:CR=1 FL=1